MSNTVSTTGGKTLFGTRTIRPVHYISLSKLLPKFALQILTSPILDSSFLNVQKLDGSFLLPKDSQGIYLL